MARFLVTSGYQQDLFYDEIGLLGNMTYIRVKGYKDPYSFSFLKN
jgi:hypothetical protein